MSRPVWRIATDTPDYTADDTSGEGARRTGGRWNAVGTALLYASETRALACLETLAHLGASSLPLNRYLVRIDIPASVWNAARVETTATLPIGWEASPPGAVGITAGSTWASSGATCLLIVPSVIVPEEGNILINPLHADNAQLVVTKIRQWLYDPRLGV